MTPKHYKVVSGKGTSKYALVAFDNALINAGIGDYNLVKVSSILPPNCRCEDKINLKKGSIIYAAYAQMVVENNQSGSAAVAIAFPELTSSNGVIFEAAGLHANAEKTVINMCIEAMNNRGRPIHDVVSTSILVCGEPDKFTCGIAAVVMW